MASEDSATAIWIQNQIQSSDIQVLWHPPSTPWILSSPGLPPGAGAGPGTACSDPKALSSQKRAPRWREALLLWVGHGRESKSLWPRRPSEEATTMPCPLESVLCLPLTGLLTYHYALN